MNKIKHLTTVFLSLAISIYSFSQSSIGSGLSAYTPGFAIGLDTRANFDISPNIEITPGLNYYFSGSALILNGDVHYLFGDATTLNYYPLAGLSFYKYNGGSTIQLNIGGGVKKPLNENISIFGEGKLALSSNTGFLMTGGLLYNLGDGGNSSSKSPKEKSTKQPKEKASSDNETNHNLFKNGFFIDGLIGTATLKSTVNSNIFRTSFGFAAKLGNKWYKGNGTNSKFGFQVIWLRMGYYTHKDGNSVSTSPLNFGFISVHKLNSNVALEANLNTGIATYHDLELEDGIFVIPLNPSVKIKYNSLTAGIDLVQSIMTRDGDFDDGQSSQTIFSLTAGLKF